MKDSRHEIFINDEKKDVIYLILTTSPLTVFGILYFIFGWFR